MTKQLLIALPTVLILATSAAFLWLYSRRLRRDIGIRAEEREKTTDVSFIIAAFHDVTKKLKEKEQELERLRALAEQRADEVESYNENILQCVMSGVVTFDRQCRVTTINRAAAEILGISPRDALGKTCVDLFGDGGISTVVDDAVRQGRVTARLKEAMISRADKTLWLGYNCTVLTDRKEDTLGGILSFSDMTEVKRLQAQVELNERLSALGEMSAGIAHELRNPMAVISGYLKLLAKKSAPSEQEIIATIANELTGMNTIIAEMLQFAKPTAVNRVPVSLRHLIEECAGAITGVLPAGHGIEISLAIEEMTLFVDEGLMRQVFLNILRNAVEAMPNGGRIAIVATATSDALHIVFQDSGTGVPPEQRRRIFLPFYTTKDTGVGMGLALAHKIVTAHGGSIAVDNNAGGVGAQFTLILPIPT